MRKELVYVVQTEGRDKDKVFLLKEMPTSRSEKWGARALLALARAGVDVPDTNMGLPGLAMAGLQSLKSLAFEDLEPLMDEMFTCVTIRPDPKRPEITRPLIEDDIEELSTRLALRTEILSLHVGFSIPGSLSTSPNP